MKLLLDILAWAIIFLIVGSLLAGLAILIHATPFWIILLLLSPAIAVAVFSCFGWAMDRVTQ